MKTRTKNELLQEEIRLTDLVWYNRHQKDQPDIGKAAAKRIEATYPQADLGPHSDFEWGMINGKLSAIRWMLGDDWDMLDT